MKLSALFRWKAMYAERYQNTNVTGMVTTKTTKEIANDEPAKSTLLVTIWAKVAMRLMVNVTELKIQLKYSLFIRPRPLSGISSMMAFRTMGRHFGQFGSPSPEFTAFSRSFRRASFNASCASRRVKSASLAFNVSMSITKC